MNHRPILRAVTKVKVKPVKWLDPGRIPLGTLTVLDGDPGMGKSTVALDYASRVSRGLAMPSGAKGDLYGEPAGVVILSAEDDASTTIRPKLELMGADLGLIYLLDGVREEADDEDDERPPKDAVMATLHDLEPIAAAIEYTRARLLIVDPLMSYLPGRTNAHKDQDIRAVFTPLIALAKKLGFAILVVRHLNKLGANPQTVAALYRGGGSIGIAGAARSVLIVGPDPVDDTRERRLLVRVKGNLSRPPKALVYHLEAEGEEPAVVVWEGESDQDADELVKPPQPDEEPSRIKEACEWLKAKLEEGPILSRELFRIAKRDGIADRTLHRARVRIGAKARKGLDGGPGWTWFYPTPDITKALSSRNGKAIPIKVRGLRSFWDVV